MGVVSVVISFNDGTKRLIDVMKELKVEPGHCSKHVITTKIFLVLKVWKTK